MKLAILTLYSILLLSVTGCSQSDNKNKGTTAHSGTVNNRVGGNCEGCEAIYESPLAFEKLNSTDTLPDFNEKGQKINISGIVYQKDGKTPAKDVVLYVYHTDQTGRYTPSPGATGWQSRHGRIRGWMKTDRNCFYQFYTLEPASYPNSNIPRHIHITIKEPDKNEYYIDEFLFDDDPFLTPSERSKQEKRGGDGIVKLTTQSNNLSRAIRNIYLGRNIPDYPSD